MADAGDLKSPGFLQAREGSSPSPGTIVLLKNEKIC